jgi:hypothetical protein
VEALMREEKYCRAMSKFIPWRQVEIDVTHNLSYSRIGFLRYDGLMALN